jgi:hypothetical protein
LYRGDAPNRQRFLLWAHASERRLTAAGEGEQPE